jgi:hypothetical protein
MKTFMRLLIAALVLLNMACEKTDRSFSLAVAGSTFQQNGSFDVKKTDILWVIDNSGSMDSSQTNLVNSFQSFINKFQTLNADFHMAVTTTDAFRSAFVANQAQSNILKALRRGHVVNSGGNWIYSPDSGVSIMDMLTPNLGSVFLTNASQGTDGSGDERAFQSIKAALSYTGNAGFLRPGANLAVIIVSDEDDFSNDSSNSLPVMYYDEENSHPVVLQPSADPNDIYFLYNNASLHSVASYKTYLDGLVGAGNYTVNMIGVLDTACKTQLNASYGGRRIGRRYMQFADLTGGVKTSLCANFGTSLDLIAEGVLTLQSTFQLGREPVVETIDPIVNGVHVLQDPVNGWTYNAADFTVTFHGSSRPPQGALIQIPFTPVRASN